MTVTTDSSRKHGPFDSRYRRSSLESRPCLSARNATAHERATAAFTDWDVFSRRYFGGGHRHDMKAVAAYQAYLLARTQPADRPLQPPPLPRQAIASWENDGGHVAGSKSTSIQRRTFP